MKTRYKVLSVLAALCAAMFVFVGCEETPSEHEHGDPVVSVIAKYPSVTIKDTDVESYNYTALFDIISDGKVITVKSEYVDSSAVLPVEGDYDVVCTYAGESDSVLVHVRGTVYEVNLSQTEITILTSQVETYNFKALFTLKKDGAVQTLDDSFVTSNVTAAAGTYWYSVSYNGITKTLVVKVIDDVIVVPSYTLKTIEESEVATYDFTNLFSLYLEGKAARVTETMLDTSEIDSAVVGDTVTVRFSYTKDGKNYPASVQVKIVADLSYVISSHDVIIYPHSENIELESLFEIRRGDEIIPVTNDMISGAVNYSKAGDYVITLNAFEQTCTATVTVEAGVVVKARSETVYILKDTDKASYAFSNDFTIVINGVKYFAIPEDFFDGLDELDFTTEGDYTVTLSVPYNTGSVSTGRPNYAYTDCEITYSVRELIGSAYAIEPVIEIIRGTVTSYNVFSNVYATVNGRRMSLTTNPDWVSVLDVYAEIVSEPLDLTLTEVQHIEIDVYVNGVDEDPIRVEFDVSVRDNVVIAAHDASVFTGATLFATDLFEVTKNGESITVTYDMISGKVDVFNPGVYPVTLELGGVSATAYVTVFDDRLKGTYKTGMTAIPSSSSDDDDDDDYYGDWSDYGDEYYSAAPKNASVEQSAASSTLKDLVFGEDGTLTVNGNAGTLLGGIDENTLTVRFSNNNYTLYYFDGIIVLDPDNSIKLSFFETKRPLVYFNDDIWNIEKSIVINYGSNYVLSGTSTTFSFDVFHVVKKDDSADMWYALYVELASKSASDTIYSVKWGEAVFAEGFTPQTGVSSSLTFGGETYKFDMESPTKGKIDKSNETSKYAGRNFTGTVDGKSARLEVSSSSIYTLKIEGNTMFTFSLNDKTNAKNWYEDKDADVLFLYDYDKGNYGDVKFSYKFQINTTDGTFTVLDRDRYYGVYELDGKKLYLDGYGTGELKPSSTSYESFMLRYTVNGDVLTVTYVRTKPTFEYGTSSEFYIGEFLNTLKVKRFTNNPFGSKLLINSIISDGAVVTLSKYRFSGAIGSRTATIVKEEIRNSITIITKDGEASDADKSNYIDLTKVSTTYSGYYQIAIKINVGGEPVTVYYSVQIVKGTLGADSPFVGEYDPVCYGNYDLTIDGNGLVILVAGGTEYVGYAEADGDGLRFKACSENGGAIVGVASSIATSAIKLTVSGSLNYSDYYIKSGLGSSRVVGIAGTVLREITISGVGKLYTLAASLSATGEIVTLTVVSGSSVENGSIVKLEKADGTVVYLEIVQWNNLTEGVTVLQNYVED